MPFVYPTAEEMSAIEQEKVARSRQGDILFDIFPIVTSPLGIISWTQMDDYTGLQQLRGLDGAPAKVDRVGKNRYSYAPGVYGEFENVDETELTLRAGSITNTSVPIDLTDIVMEAQDQLIVRENDLLRYVIATLLTTGVIAVPLPGGQIGFQAEFSVQSFDASDWSNTATGTPLNDFRNIQQLSTGKSINFGPGAVALANLKTANQLLANQNTADFKGQRVSGGNTIATLDQYNAIMLSAGLPRLVIYNETYTDNKTSVQTTFIPDGKCVVVGQRNSGARVGEYKMTRNVNNPGFAPGSYDFVVDKTGNAPNGQRQVPAQVEVHRGHNGGPVIYYPSAVVVMDVGA